MANWEQNTGMSFPKPGKALIGFSAAIFAVWLMFAVAVNWGGASLDLFLLFCGNNQAIAEGQLWRLVTAPLMHYPQGDISHVLWVLIGLYFLTPALEQSWGSARVARFLVGSALIAYGFQLLLAWVLPATLSARLVPPYWFGAFPVLEAISIAWALSFRGQQVRLFFVLPVSASALVWFVVAINLLRVIAAAEPHEGLLAPFGGMFAGWLLGAGTPSPLRRAYLKWRLRALDRETHRSKQERGERVKKTGLSVIEGGRSGPKRGTGKGTRGPDGSWLN
jgi:membrane associated rhomboid family serine protease